MLDLSKSELEIIKRILNGGIVKSSDSLSFFTKSNVSIKTFDLFLESNNENSFKSITEDKVTVLSTKLMGELSGECYLIFNEDDKDELLSICLPKSILEDPDKKQEMGNALLLELDNIVSASAITEFSNVFKKTVYGGVPYLDDIKGSDLLQFISDKNIERYSLHLKVEMISENHKISPEFIWTLGQDFIDSLKLIASQEA